MCITLLIAVFLQPLSVFPSIHHSAREARVLELFAHKEDYGVESESSKRKKYLMHVKNDIRSSHKLPIDEYLGECRPEAACNKLTRLSLKTIWKHFYFMHVFIRV